MQIINAILFFAIVNISIANVLDLFYTPLAGNSMYKMDMCNKQKCSELNETEADKLTKLAGTLAGQTAAIASEQGAVFFSNIPETSILCQDSAKEFNSTNTVRYLNAIFLRINPTTNFFERPYSINIIFLVRIARTILIFIK